MYDNMVYRLDELSTVSSVSVSARFFDRPGKMPDNEIYSLTLEFSPEDLPNYLRRNLANIIDNLAAKEGLFVNNSARGYVQLGYTDDLLVMNQTR